MATLIPSYSSCLSRMTTGEKRFAQRLETMLEDDYLCWYDVPVEPGAVHPDFIILHPKWGLIILEVVDWKLEKLRAMTLSDAPLFTDAGAKQATDPLEQARQYAQAVVTELERDPLLTFSSGRMKGKPLFPWTYGVVLTGITRSAFTDSGLGEALDRQRVLCQDEISESIEAAAFQQRLREMFHLGGYGHLSHPQIDRIRWRLFPEIRLPARQWDAFDDAESQDGVTPEPLRLLDVQQERLVRSLREGHHVIHGVAGSGKTLILAHRAEQLARTCAKPVLVLCHNKALARQLDHWMHVKGVANKVQIGTFHAWCHRQLTTYHVGLPAGDASLPGYGDTLVQRVIQGLERHLIPAGQYEAILIDEGHEFHPEWLQLVVRMADPLTHSLLVLYDDAQSTHDTGHQRDLSFKRLGIQTRGRTTRLQVNYRNTVEILDFAAGFARPVLAERDADEDSVPNLAPVSAGRHGDRPSLVRLPSLRDEANYLVEQLKAAHRGGTPWHDMAVLYRHWEPVGKTINSMFRLAGIPLTGKDNLRFSGKQDKVKLLPFHSGKGLEFPLVAIPGLDQENDEANAEDEARLLYMAMTRATEQLLVTGTSHQ